MFKEICLKPYVFYVVLFLCQFWKWGQAMTWLRLLGDAEILFKCIIVLVLKSRK